MPSPTDAMAAAREHFLAMVADLRPELHRYCARLVGSVIDGEDIVQDTLARGFYVLSQTPEPPPLRPWLFRIAHNGAVDFLRRKGKFVVDEISGGDEELASSESSEEPIAVRAALARFQDLPLSQRSAVILKDVLGHSLEETAETMGTTVLAVKAALVRGRSALRGPKNDETSGSRVDREQLDRYASLFNAKNWDGLRALVADDCRLDLISKSQRRGKGVKMYFERYAKEDVTVRPGMLGSEPVLAAYVGGAEKPAYFIVLSFDGEQVTNIRDFRYVPYIASEAEFVASPS